MYTHYDLCRMLIITLCGIASVVPHRPHRCEIHSPLCFWSNLNVSFTFFCGLYVNSQQQLYGVRQSVSGTQGWNVNGGVGGVKFYPTDMYSVIHDSHTVCCVVSRLADYQWFIYGIAAVKWSCEVKSGRVLWIAFLCWCAVKKLLTYSCRCSLSWERQQMSTTHSLMQVQPKLRTTANVHYSLTHAGAA